MSLKEIKTIQMLRFCAFGVVMMITAVVAVWIEGQDLNGIKELAVSAVCGILLLFSLHFMNICRIE